MRNKIRKRIFFTLLTIITLTIIVIPFYPGLSQFKDIWSFFEAKSASGLTNNNIIVTNAGEGTTVNEAVSSSEKTEPKSNLTIPPEDSSYLMLNLRTGERLLEKNEDTRRAPASTIKLLTGILVHDKLQETELITVGEEVKIEESTLGLKPGDQILVKDLLTAMYVCSANDAANALAVAAYGTMDNFLQAANQYALEIGCTDSQFKTANGLPEAEQYTTAQDLAKIASKFLENEALMDYVKKKEATIEWVDVNGWKQIREVSNTNQLLGVYPGDQGLKTGTTTEAGQCLVTFVTREDGDILLVLLGSKQRYSDTVELLDQGFAKIRTRSALKNIIADPNTFYQTPGFFSR